MVKSPVRLRALVVEDSADDAEIMLRRLQKYGYDLDWRRVENEKDYRRQLDPSLDIILCDFALPQFDALRALDILQARKLDIPFIIVSGAIGEDIAVMAIKKGAADYLIKDRLARLGSAVAAALEQKRLRQDRRQQERKLAAIGHVSAALRTAHTGAEMLPIILDQLMELLPAAGARVDLYDQTSGEIEVALGRGAWAPMTGAHLKPGEGISSHVINTGQAYVMKDLSSEPRLALANLTGSVRGAICTPLIAQMETIGTLWVGQLNEINEVDVIYQQAVHATNLINQILDFSRRSIMACTAVDLLPFLKEMMRLWQRTLPENIIIELSHDEKEYIVNADPTRLQQGLMNLALNARDAMPGGGTLRLELSQQLLNRGEEPPVANMSPGRWLCMTVSDNGAGISPESLQRLFEPFFTTKDPGKGTGLGLAQVYGIVRQHNGYITVNSRVASEDEDSSGTTFTIYLPLLAKSQTPLEVTKTSSITNPGEATVH